MPWYGDKTEVVGCTVYKRGKKFHIFIESQTNGKPNKPKYIGWTRHARQAKQRARGWGWRNIIER